MNVSKFQQVGRAFGLSLKLLRLSTFCSAVALVVAVLAARSVYGSAGQAIYEATAPWSRQTGTLDRGTYRVKLNGGSLLVSSEMTDAPVHDVLEAAAAECTAHAGGFDHEVSKLPGVAMAKLTSWVFGVARQEWKNRGYVACIERDGDGGLRGLVHGLGELAKTGDIAKLGTFRYVAVDRGPGATKTHVLRQRTEGELNLVRMFPESGDVPGTDLAEVPRPAASRRLLDASVEGSSFGVRVYDAPRAPGAVLGAYDHDLGKRWERVALPDGTEATERAYRSGDTVLFVSAAPQGSGSVVSLATAPPR